MYSNIWFITKLSGLLSMIFFGSEAYSNTIITNSCTPSASPGESVNIHSCGANNYFFFEKTFGQTPGHIDIDLSLTNNINGDNPPPQAPTIYRIEEIIYNTSNIDWIDFEIFAPDASLLSVVAASTFKCVNSSATGITCSGGIVPAMLGAFAIDFDLGTPKDQSALKFSILETPSFSVPEPASLAITGLGLLAAAFAARRRTS